MRRFLLNHARWMKGPNQVFNGRSKQVPCFAVNKRSFSSSRQQDPKLSRRAKVDLMVIAAGAVGSWLYLRDSDWDRDTWNENQRLLDSVPRDVGDDTSLETSNDDLPLPLRTYLETAMSNAKRKRPQVVSVDQMGSFFASQQWYPFHSNLLIKTASSHRDDSPGFVWEADVTIMGMPNRVLETFIQGKGSIITKAWGKVPLIQVEEEEPYILFWLAMAPLIPASFAPSNAEQRLDIASDTPLITWNSVQDLCTCSGTLIDRATNERFEMELQFDSTTHLLQSIKVTSPCLPYPWQVQYRNYRKLEGGGSLVPSHIEVGKWKNDGHLELHLKITNERMQQIASSVNDNAV